ncbi:MAG: hypothetical protein ACTTI8_03645 [Prevotella intermedia]
MNTTNRPKTGMERSRLDWSGNMQVIRKGGGEIAMTEGELARFFGVTWKKLNGKLQVIQKSSNLHLDEMCAGEKAMVRDNELTGYAPLYPLPIIIVLSFMLDSTEAHLFREHICQELQNTAFVIIPIFLFGNTDN